MPELAPALDRLAEAVDRPGAATLLSHLTLKSPFAGCTQTSVEGILLRNYDFEARYCDRVIVRSNFLRPVLGMNDVLWGMLDGVNDAGLAVSLTYGGRPDFRPGLSVLLVVRYLLETCDTVAEAGKAVRRLPFATVQNLTLVDRSRSMSVFVGPDREAALAPEVCVANHQDRPVPPELEEGSGTVARRRATHDGSNGRRAPEATRVRAVQWRIRHPLHRGLPPPGGSGHLPVAGRAGRAVDDRVHQRRVGRPPG